MLLDENVQYISEKNICDRLTELPDELLIYGAGAYGREIFELLTTHKKKIIGFWDRNAVAGSQLFGCSVWNFDNIPETLKVKNPTVVFAIVMDLEERKVVFSELYQAGFTNIVEAQSVRCFLVQPDDKLESDSMRDYYNRKVQQINKAACLFQDKKSQQLYWSNVHAHFTREYTNCYESPLAEQYFPLDVNWKNHHKVVDCGAYIGDTAAQLLLHYGHLEQYIAFEPNLSNFKKLSKFCRNHPQLGCVTLFPSGVSGYTEMKRFDSGTGSGKLSERGSDIVSCVALDDILYHQSVDLIKMDIEGAELAALTSAKNIITKNRPDLAICVYHNINHIWDIPLFIDGLKLGYEFFLRCYNSCTMESVLYARVKG